MSEFKRDERYIVVKLKRIDGDTAEALRDFLQGWQVPTEECVVVEHDWPNYEATWSAIQQIEEGTYDPDELDKALARVAELEADSSQCQAVGFIQSDGMRQLSQGHPARIYPPGCMPSPFEKITHVYTRLRSQTDELESGGRDDPA